MDGRRAHGLRRGRRRVDTDAQAVGRFVRARKRGETASVFLPSVPVILAHAGSMEVERDHALDRPKDADDDAPIWSEEEGMLAAANAAEAASDDLQGQFEALELSLIHI